METVLITGASTGIGLASVQRMLGLGWKVFAGVRKTSDFNRLKELGAIPLYMDVTDQSQITEAFQQIAAAGELNAIVNNAGIAVAGPVEGVEIDTYRQQFDVNFFGPIHVIQKALPLIRKSRGRIVNISSISGLISTPLLSPYTASKFALEALSDSLRREMMEFGVKVILIEPGNIATPIWEKSEKTNEAQLEKYPEEIKKLYGDQIERLRVMARDGAKNATPVERVADAIEKALCARRPKTRYLVGWDAKIGGVLSATLPDPLMDKLMRHFV